MNLPDIECLPPGDFAYLKFGKYNYGKGRMLVFTWEQVEDSDQVPMFTAYFSEQELTRLAKVALKLAGNELYKQVHVPEDTWGGKQDKGE